MAKSKDFDEFYGKVLADTDPGKKKFKLGKLGANEVHPFPVDAVILDKNQNILTDSDIKQEHIFKKRRDKNSKSRNGSRNSVDSGIEQTIDEEHNFGDMTTRSAVSRTGVLLKFDADTQSLHEVSKTSSPASKYESDEDLEHFCVDHMQLCISRKERFRNRGRPFDSPFSSSGSGLSTFSSSKGSGLSSRSSNSLISSTMFNQDTLERLYAYAGVIIEERQALKQYLITRKAAIIEQYYQYMEEVIAQILKLKEDILRETEDLHTTNLRGVSRETTKFHRIRHECRMALQNIQENLKSSNSAKSAKSMEVLDNANQRADVFDRVLKRFYDSTERYEYQFEPNTDMESTFAIQNLGHVEVNVDTPTLPPFLSVGGIERDSELQFISCCEGAETSSAQTCAFTGITYLTKDTLLVADWKNSFVKVFNKHSVMCDKLEFEESPWDVIQVSDGRAAVTVPKLKAVYFVECDPNLHVTGYFPTDCECFGITISRDKYVITCDPWSNFPSVRIFSDTGDVLQCFSLATTGENLFKCPLYVCTDYFNTVIFVSDSSADCVYILSLDGSELQQYEHGLLEYPTGVAVDRNNNVFVCCKSYSNIHVIDSHGKHKKIELRAKDGLHSPRAVCFHPHGDAMVVTDLDDTICNGYLMRHIT